MQNLSTAIELLAPVPVAHLESGLESLQKTGGVLFGSDAFELFLNLDHLRKGLSVQVWIYESFSNSKAVVSWRGIYEEFISSNDHHKLEHLQAMRPPSTKTDGAFAVYWRLSLLEKLDQSFPISNLYGRGRSTPFTKFFVPRGPTLIEPRF